MATRAPALAFYSPEDAKRDENRDEWIKLNETVAPVIADLNKLAGDAVKARGVIEERWMRSLEQYHAKYDEKVAAMLRADPDRSSLFINLTRAKTNAWISRLGDMLFPNDEKNWGINATPVPELSKEARALTTQAEELDTEAQAMEDRHNAMVEQNGPQPGMVDQYGNEMMPQALSQAREKRTNAEELRKQAAQQQRERELAQERAANMERLIDDQLTESNYPAVCRKIIEDMCKVGVGVIKGPIVNNKPRRQWREIETGTDGAKVFKMEDRGDTAARFRRVDFWHFFPDPTAESMEDCEYTFERHLPNKKMLRQMARELGFYEPALAKLIKEGPAATGGPNPIDFTYLTTLRSLENDGASSEVIDPLKQRFLVWEYHGPLEGEQLAAMLRITGKLKEADRIEQGAVISAPMVRLFFCGSQLLLIEPDYVLDSGESLYSVATFESGDRCVMGGVGVPHLMRHEQAMLNSAVRMMMDNASLAVAPQIVIDKEAIAPENGRWKLAARKVWQWITTPGGPRTDSPFQTFNIPINQEYLAAIIEMTLRFIDETVSMPLIAQGEMGAHVTKTSSGMSMLFNSANVGFRRVVKNWDDDLTTGTIRRTYDFNMQFSEDENVKGDMKVEARGTSVLLVRELQAEQLITLIREWAQHPVIGIGFRAYHAMRLVLQAMSINPDDLLLPEKDYLDKLKQMQDAQGEGEQDPEAMRIASQERIAELESKTRLDVANIGLQVAEMRMKGEFAALASRENISMAQIEAMFQKGIGDIRAKVQIARDNNATSERKFAAELGAEKQAKREAEAQGMEIDGSGGFVNLAPQAKPK